jgi:tRNA-dihydrouridine synthase
MKTPEVVIACMQMMTSATTLPVTVKCRLGVDEFDSYEYCHEFVKNIAEKGRVQHFIIHARKAFLKGIFFYKDSTPKKTGTFLPSNTNGSISSSRTCQISTSP